MVVSESTMKRLLQLICKYDTNYSVKVEMFWNNKNEYVSNSYTLTNNYKVVFRTFNKKAFILKLNDIWQSLKAQI